MHNTVIDANTNALTESTINELMKIVWMWMCAANHPTIIQGHYFLGVNYVILVYYSSSFLSTLIPNASSGSLSINIPVTYYPADGYHRYYDTRPE